MKRVDILVCLELFNIRKSKNYPKQIIKDSYDVVRALCNRKYSLGLTRPINDFKTFKDEFRSHYLEKSPLEFRYCQEFLKYLDGFEYFIVDTF